MAIKLFKDAREKVALINSELLNTGFKKFGMNKIFSSVEFNYALCGHDSEISDVVFGVPGKYLSCRGVNHLVIYDIYGITKDAKIVSVNNNNEVTLEFMIEVGGSWCLSFSASGCRESQEMRDFLGTDQGGSDNDSWWANIEEVGVATIGMRIVIYQNPSDKAYGVLRSGNYGVYFDTFYFYGDQATIDFGYVRAKKILSQ